MSRSWEKALRFEGMARTHLSRPASQTEVKTALIHVIDVSGGVKTKVEDIRHLDGDKVGRITLT